MTRTALITGVTGQDGAYLARLLLEKGFVVKGTTRGMSLQGIAKLQTLGIDNDIEIFEVDLTNRPAVEEVVKSAQFDQIYNLAAPSSVAESFKRPLETVMEIVEGALGLLEAVRVHSPQTRYYQASSSEMFGNNPSACHNEESQLCPLSPYAAAKVCAHSLTEIYRKYHEIFACSGILFNHESPLRGCGYVSRKITKTLARIESGESICLKLGSIDVLRDFGYAGDYVQAMYLMTNAPKADDYVIATGTAYSIREFVNFALEFCDIKYEWVGEQLDEQCIDLTKQKVIVEIDPSLYRPLDVNRSKGDASKARDRLNWNPTVDFQALVSMMMRADQKHLNRL